MGYVKDALKGFGWLGSFRGVTRLFAIVRTIILARILTEEQLGVYGLVLIVLAILELLTETGVNVFLIQQNDDIDEYIDTAWVVSIGRGLLISILLFISAPFIGSFFNSPSVVPLIYLSALVPFFRGFINPAEVKLVKDLQFSREFLLRTTVFFLDTLIAIFTVILLKSPAGLVYGLIFGSIVELVLSYILVRPWPRLEFKKAKALKVIKAGKWMTFAGIFDYLARNGDNLVVAKLLGTGPLGFYQLAYSLSSTPATEISDVTGRVAFPIYTRIAGDKDRLKRAYGKLLLAVTIVAIPISIVFYVFAQPLVYYLLGSNWLPIVEPLKILAIFGCIRAISGTSSAVFLGVKRQDLVTLITFIRFTTLVICVVPLTLAMGITGTSIAALISSLVPVPVILYNLTKVLR